MEQFPDRPIPVSGYSSRLKRHLEHLKSEMGRCISEDERIDLIKWYFSNGSKFGLSREDLESQIHNFAPLKPLLSDIRFRSPGNGKFPPHFRIGERVKVILNAKNITARAGEVHEQIWHHKNGEWMYLIRENGKNISKRYLRSDLNAL